MQQPSAAAAAVTLISQSFCRRASPDRRARGPARPPPPAAAAADASYHPRLLDLRPLNGLRALSSIAVVVYFSWLLWSVLGAI